MRRSFVHLSIATLVMTLVPAIGSPAAGAVSTLQCAASASIYTVRSTGGLWLAEHLEPETGLNSWLSQRQINTFGADSKRLAGPNGVIYSIVSGGEVRRRRWNGSTWDTFAGGAQFEVIDTNSAWARYITPDYRNRITVDDRGDFYTIEPDGNLHWRSYNPATRSWRHRIIEAGWSRFDLIVAVGYGVLVAREPSTGALWYLRYHAPSHRVQLTLWWFSRNGQEWNNVLRMFSAGGGLLYGVLSSGELRWWQLTGAGEDGYPIGPTLVPAAGKPLGGGWQNEYETFAAPDSCQRVGIPPEPTRPQITPTSHEPVDLTRSINGNVHYSYIDAEGRAVYAEITNLTGTGSSGAAAVPGLVNVSGTTSTTENQNGSIQIVARGLDSEVYTNTRVGTAWSTAATSVGFMRSSAVLGRQPDNTLVAYAADADDWPWLLPQLSPNGQMSAWRETEANGAGVLNGHVFKVINTSTGAFHLIGGEWCPGISTHWDGGVGLTSVCGHDRGFLTGHDALLMPDNTLRLFATLDNGIVQTVRGIPNPDDPTFGWPDEWADIPGITAAGRPSATIAPDGLIKIVVRATDGFIYYTSQTAPGASTYTPWQEITGFTEESATDPTALAVPGSNTWVVAYRTDLDVPRLRRYQPGPGVASGGPFVDVPITPPV